MGKSFKLLIGIFLFFATSLLGSELYQKQINEFDAVFSRASSEEILKLHHMLKNIYIQSIIQNNNNLKADALSRLVKSSHALNLDATPYEKELITLKSTIPKAKENQEPIPLKEKVTKKKSEPTSLSIKTSTSSLAALSVLFEEGDVTLHFNQPVSIKNVKSFLLKAKGTYRYVFDVPGALMGSSRTYESAIINQVRVAQYDKKTIRIVFSHSKPLKLQHRAKDKQLFIGLSSKSDAVDVSSKAYNEKSATKRFDPNKKTIVIDPGHGGKDGGAVNGKYLEKEVVLALSLKIGAELKKRGYRVYYTRDKDVYTQLRTRTRIANDKNADLFISVHANAAPTKNKRKSMEGVETFFLSPARSERSKNVAALENKSDVEEMNHFSKQTYLNFLNREKIIASNKFALDIHQGMFNSISKHYKIHDGGVREAPFWVLVGAQMPSVLLEIGYITHPEEVKRIFNNTYQKRIANGVANGVDAYFQKNN